MTQYLVSTLNDAHIDRLIDLGFKVVQGLGYAGSLILPALILYFQNKNNKAREKDLKVNTDMTRENSEKLSELAQLKDMTTLAKRLGSTEPVFYTVDLPPDHFVPFGLSEGAKVYWKSEPCDKGRKVRFLVHGKCCMGFHFHKVTEIIFNVRGTLYFDTAQGPITLNPGDSYEAAPETVHSARFEEPGEATCHWPDQDGDKLEIGIWP